MSPLRPSVVVDGIVGFFFIQSFFVVMSTNTVKRQWQRIIRSPKFLSFWVNIAATMDLGRKCLYFRGNWHVFLNTPRDMQHVLFMTGFYIFFFNCFVNDRLATRCFFFSSFFCLFCFVVITWSEAIFSMSQLINMQWIALDWRIVRRRKVFVQGKWRHWRFLGEDRLIKFWWMNEMSGGGRMSFEYLLSDC